MHPEYYWYAAMLLIVLPAMLWGRSGIASIIAGAWLIGQIAYLTGLPLVPVQVLCHVTAIVLVLGNAQKAGALLAGALFIPRAINDATILSHMTDPINGWWYDYWLAWAQLGFVLITLEWDRFKTNLLLGARGIGMPRMHLRVGHAR